MSEKTIQANEIEIGGEAYTVESATSEGSGILIETDGREEFILFPDSETAGMEAEEYWRDMAANDPEEFRCIVGDACLIAWALGQYAGPGNEQVNSLEDWFAITADHPEEYHASWDGEENDVDGIGEEALAMIEEETGKTVTSSWVAYRRN